MHSQAYIHRVRDTNGYVRIQIKYLYICGLSIIIQKVSHSYFLQVRMSFHHRFKWFSNAVLLALAHCDSGSLYCAIFLMPLFIRYIQRINFISYVLDVHCILGKILNGKSYYFYIFQRERNASGEYKKKKKETREKIKIKLPKRK